MRALKVPEVPSMQPLSGGSVERGSDGSKRGRISRCRTTLFRSRNLHQLSKENQMLNVFVSIQNRLAMLRDEQGQTMAEYGVVLAVIAVIVVTALTALSGGISGAIDSARGVLSP